MSWLSSLLGMDAQHAAGQLNSQAGTLRNNAAAGYQGLQKTGSEGFGSTLPQVQSQLGNNPFLHLFQTGGTDNPFLGSYLKTAGVGGQPGDGGQYSVGGGSPYALTPEQQTELNGHLSDLDTQHQAGITGLREQLAQAGINDPRHIAAAEAHFTNQFSALKAQHAAGFGETARTNRQQALGGLMNAGEGAYNTQTQGLQGLLAMYNAMQGEGIGGQANLTSGTQAQANQQQGMANGALGSLLQLGGYAAGGGFNPMAMPHAPAYTPPAPTNAAQYGAMGGMYGMFPYFGGA